MTNEQWEELLAVIDGQEFDTPPVGLIIDSPWLPGWAGMSILDYYTSETRWLEANLRAVNQWPQVMFLPGFWSEFGMCTEPSAFGAKCLWHENDFPFADKVCDSLDDAARIKKPDPRRDGLAPFVLKRLEHCLPQIEAAGHSLRFAVTRGPLNIAGFLLGNSEFLTGMKMQPDETHALLGTITDFLVDWIQLQAATFPTIDGILVLDDMVGFCGEDDCVEFAKPYLTRLFAAINARVRLFHNDAPGIVCAPHLESMGINMFNFSHDHSIAEMRKRVGDNITLLGNVPPRDVLAQGTPQDVAASVQSLLDALESKRRIVLSCGGGVPPNVYSENIDAFVKAAAGKNRD